MGNEHLVQEGDCLVSLACDYGFNPATLWNHPQNATLRLERKIGTVLKQGDKVYIPGKEIKEYTRPTDATHSFRRLGVPEKLKIRFLDETDRPLASKRYVLTVDGTISEGKTNSEGFLLVSIAPNAKKAQLVLFDGEVEQIYDFQLGHLAPVDELLGVQMRLLHLGYYCETDGEMGENTKNSILAFQKDSQLELTGELNEATKQMLVLKYGA
jgi:hypothetical protein